MKEAILIIFLNGMSGDAVSVSSVNFKSMESCQAALNLLVKKEKSNYSGKNATMKFVQGTYTCVIQ